MTCCCDAEVGVMLHPFQSPVTSGSRAMLLVRVWFSGMICAEVFGTLGPSASGALLVWCSA